MDNPFLQNDTTDLPKELGLRPEGHTIHCVLDPNSDKDAPKDEIQAEVCAKMAQFAGSWSPHSE